MKRGLFTILLVLSLLSAVSGCSESRPRATPAPTMTFKMTDAATGMPLRDVRVTHGRSGTITRWTAPLTMTSKNAPVDEVRLRPDGRDAHVTVPVHPAFDHSVTFARDGYYQVRVQVWKRVGGEAQRIFVEPVVSDPREPYFAPPADVIVIPLNRMPPRGQRHMWLK